MIFVSLGTHDQPFRRALEMIRPLAQGGERLVIQHGSTPPDPSIENVEWHEFVEYQEIVGLMSQARVVVCHAGVGSIMTALRLGRTPVVLCRLREHGEHVDDHQTQIVELLAQRGLIVVPGTSLSEAVEVAAASTGIPWGPGKELATAVVRACSRQGRLLRARDVRGRAARQRRLFMRSM